MPTVALTFHLLTFLRSTVLVYLSIDVTGALVLSLPN